MIERIEELCPELDALLFADGENLEQRNIPVLVAWPLNNVSTCVAERAHDSIGSKGARVKQRSRYTWVSIGISDHIGPGRAGDLSRRRWTMKRSGRMPEMPDVLAFHFFFFAGLSFCDIESNDYR